MAKHSIELSTIPTEEKESEQRHLLYDLFRQLHRVHSEPMFGTRLDPKPSESLADAERPFREAFSRGTLMVEPLFYSGSAAYDFQYLELAGTKHDQDHDWIVQNIGISIKQTVRDDTRGDRAHRQPDRRPVRQDRFRSRPLLSSRLSVHNLRLCQGRIGHASAASAERRRLSRLHNQPHLGRARRGDRARTGKPVVVEHLQALPETAQSFLTDLKGKLLLAEVASGLGKLQVPTDLIGEAKRVLAAAQDAVAEGSLGYGMLVARRPEQEGPQT